MANGESCVNCMGRVTRIWMHDRLIACSRACRDELARKEMSEPIFVAPPRMDLRAHLLKQYDPGDACACLSCQQSLTAPLLNET